MRYHQKHFCHGRGRGFEPRRPRHTFHKTYGIYGTLVTSKSGFDYGCNKNALTQNVGEILRSFHPDSEPSSLQSCSVRPAKCEFMACVYTSTVILLLACRKISCSVFTFSPFALSNVPGVAEVCRPMFLLMPTFRATGFTYRFMRLSGQ
jgi:hypothetical protein